ncbi:MAG: transporter substrate-binding domain-containing protein [Desulfobacterales bacterium]|nr:transporter substrate-binding domain-containing protein [Desulfobacterales bacterium]
MKKIICQVILLILIPIFAFSIELDIVTEILAPLNYAENGKVTGFSTEIVEQLLKETGIKGNIRVYPWERAYKKALEEENVLIYTITRTEARENLFKWVGPISDRNIYLYKLKKRKDININNLEDAKKFRVGALIGSAAAKSLINTGFTENVNLFPVPDEAQNVRKIMLNRVDLIIILDWALAWQGKQQEIALGTFEKVLPVDTELKYYLGFSRQTSDEIVDKFQGSLEKIDKEGIIEMIKNKYMKF